MFFLKKWKRENKVFVQKKNVSELRVHNYKNDSNQVTNWYIIKTKVPWSLRSQGQVTFLEVQLKIILKKNSV